MRCMMGRVDGVEGALITRLHTEVGGGTEVGATISLGARQCSVCCLCTRISVGVHLETMVEAQTELCESSDSVQADTPS